MIQDIAWSPRFAPSTTAAAASNAEAIAGTDTSKFITPAGLAAAAEYHAAPVVNGRSPRQGLVFNGTDGGSATMGSSIGVSSATIDLILDIPSSNPLASRGVFTLGPNSVSANYANTLHAELRTDGKLWVNLSGATTSDYRRVESSSSLVSLFGGKRVRLTVVRDSSAATLAVYVNAVALATTETTGGSAPAWSGNVTGTYFVPGRISASEIHVGYHSLVGFYNRALSASEVVALYESGAPAGADYNSASNTAINTNTAVDGVAGNNTFAATAGGSFTGASATGFTAVSGGGAYAAASFQPNFTVQPGQIIRVTYTATVNSGTVLASLMNSSVSSISSSHTVTTGTRTVEFVATAASTSARVIFGSSGGSACNFSVSSVSVVRAGLLLAPDAAQAGGGLTWYDTSGNAANITLPASGVSWNVPTSGYVTSGSSLNLSAGGTNQNITLTPSGTGFAQIVGGSLAVASFIRGGGFAQGIGVGTTGSVPFVQGYASNTFASTANVSFQPTGGNFLIGTTIDGGQKLQVSGDLRVNHTGSAVIDINSTAAAGSATRFLNSGTVFGYLGSGKYVISNSYDIASIALATSGAQSLYLGTNGTTALTLSGSDQSATFAGNVTLNNNGIYQSATTAVLRSNGTNAGCYVRANGTGKVIIDTGAGLDIQTGSLQLPNAYQAATVVPTGYVTIKDSTGTTYKVCVLL